MTFGLFEAPLDVSIEMSALRYVGITRRVTSFATRLAASRPVPTIPMESSKPLVDAGPPLLAYRCIHIPQTLRTSVDGSPLFRPDPKSGIVDPTQWHCRDRRAGRLGKHSPGDYHLHSPIWAA
jgi:hypothetical protein